MVKEMVKDQFYIQTDKFIKVNGKIICLMEKELIIGQKEEFIKVIIKMVKRMDKE